MIFEGDKSVIAVIKEKKRLMEEGKPHEHLRPLLFIDGGLMKGAYGIGASLALEELGLDHVFSYVVGISSGAPTVAYLLARETIKGANIMVEEGCSRKTINMWRIWNQVDTKYFMSVLKENKENKLSLDNHFSSYTKLYIGVADYRTGKPELLEPKNAEELFTAIQASVLMPNISTDIVKFNDIRYVDGGFTRPHALKKVIDKLDATHILVITNQDKTVSTIPKLERLLNHTIFRWRMPKALRFAAHERKKERFKVIEEMNKNHHVPHALVWGDHSIRSMERDPAIVRSVIERSRVWWRELLADKSADA